MIEIKNVTKTFNGFKALDDLTMTVPDGAIYGLLGPNGAGKSTIIKHITGILKQDSGEVIVGGEAVFENSAIKTEIAYIPDDVYYFNAASINDMMKFYRGIYPNFSMFRYKKLLAAFELNNKAKIRSFSRGMQKQAAFILAASTNPKLLVMDEPVDGLDPVMRRQVWAILMADVAEHGTTVLVSSHNLRELEDVCDHVGIMHKGKMLIERSLSELQDNLVKVQIALPDGVLIPDYMDILSQTSAGRVQTIIAKGTSEEVANQLSTCTPIFMDILPLSLEEIFIYELGGEHYEVKNVIL